MRRTGKRPVERGLGSPRGQRAEASARPPGRPPGASGDQTRERVLAAALETFAETGLAGASMRDIARRARIRVSSLYHYFASKEALYREVQERWQAEVRDLVLSVLGKGLELADTTREIVGRLFDYLLAHRAYVQLSCRLNLEGGVLMSGSDTRWLGLAEGFLKPAELRGLVKQVDPVSFIVTIDALVHWHIVNDVLYRRLLGKGLEDAEVAQRTRAHIIDVALRTLGLE